MSNFKTYITSNIYNNFYYQSQVFAKPGNPTYASAPSLQQVRPGTFSRQQTRETAAGTRPSGSEHACHRMLAAKASQEPSPDSRTVKSHWEKRGYREGEKLGPFRQSTAIPNTEITTQKCQHKARQGNVLCSHLRIQLKCRGGTAWRSVESKCRGGGLGSSLTWRFVPFVFLGRPLLLWGSVSSSMKW